MLDKKIFEYFYNLNQLELVENIAFILSYPLTYGALVFLLLWAIFWNDKKMRSFSIIFLSGLSAWVLSYLIKYLFQAPRPFVGLGIEPLYNETGFSFPSSHTAVFFSLAVVSYSINRTLGVGVYILASLIALSRLVLGVHYPSDILGGVFLGCIVGFLFIYLFKKLKL